MIKQKLGKVGLLAGIVVGVVATTQLSAAPTVPDHLSERAARFDIHSPLPVKPCNGKAFTKGDSILFQWQSVPMANLYRWRFLSGGSPTDSIQTAGLGVIVVGNVVGSYQWNVMSHGTWGWSEESQTCDFSIAQPV